MNIIVTGGGGFIGKHLVRKLVDQKNQVLMLDNFTVPYDTSSIHDYCIIKYFDVRQQWNRLRDIKDFNAEVIFHLAALPRIGPSFNRPVETIDVNANGTLQMLEYARQHKCRVIYAGSSSVLADPYSNPYAHSKMVGEEHCRMYQKCYNLSVAIARFYNVYGPGHERKRNATLVGLFEQAKIAKQPVTIYGDGEQKRDFTHVEDVCDALLKMADKVFLDSTIFEIGKGKNYSVNEVADMFGFPQSQREYKEGWVGPSETLANNANAQILLGWRPVRGLPGYISDFITSITSIA